MTPSWIGTVGTNGGYGHCWGRSDKFCMTVGLERVKQKICPVQQSTATFALQRSNFGRQTAAANENYAVK